MTGGDYGEMLVEAFAHEANGQPSNAIRSAGGIVCKATKTVGLNVLVFLETGLVSTWSKRGMELMSP